MIIFSNYDMPDESEVRETILMNGYDESEITDEMITEWSYDLLALYWDDIYTEFERFFEDKRLLLFGSIGRWNGRITGWETHYSFEELFRKATMDCDYWEFSEEKGHLYLKCSHHDGTNSYEIKVLTEKGSEYLTNWEYDWDNKRSADYIGAQLVKRYSRLPKFSTRKEI